MAINSSRIKRTVLALTALMLLMVPNLLSLAAFAQAAPVTPSQTTSNAGNSGSGVAPGATTVQNTDPDSPYPVPQVNTIQETAEQKKTQVVNKVNDTLMKAILTRESGRNTETYNGMAAWFGDDMISNLFANIGQLIGRWLSEFIDSWISSTVQFLAAFLRTFVLNPNIAVNGVQNTPGVNGGQPDDISPYVREAAGTMYGIAVDLLLLLFILCIWKFWAEAAWRGGGHIFGSVGRLIFTAGLMLGWPTIYAFEIQITNEMIKAIYFTGGDQITQLDVALTAAVKAGLVGTGGLLANAFAPVIGGAVGGAVGGTVGGIIAFAGLIIYLILGVVLITQIVYILVLKAIQTGLLTAQYMFAPIFLVFFATPDTENVCSGFVKSFVEVSLWTFVWVGLLKIMVIILYSQFNPWGKITMAVGILQIMIQVPTFLARAQISPMSDFISAGLVTGGLMKGASALANKAAGALTQFSKYVTSDMYAARGLPTSKKVGINNTPSQGANPELGKSLKDAGKDTKLGKDGPPTNGLAMANSLKNKEGAKTDEHGNLLGADGKPITTPQTKAQSESAKAAHNMTPAALATMAAVGAGAVLPGMEANGALNKDAEDEKARKKLDALAAQAPVAKKGEKKTAQATPPASSNASANAAMAADLSAFGDPAASKTDKDKLDQDKSKTGAPARGKDAVIGGTNAALDSAPVPPPAEPTVADASKLTSSTRGRLMNGGLRSGAPVAANANKDKEAGAKLDQQARVLVSGSEEGPQVNTSLQPEAANKPVKPATPTTSVGPGGANLDQASTALGDIPALPTRPAGASAINARAPKTAGTSRLEAANSGPNINNGKNWDATTNRQGANVPAGAVDDGNPINEARANFAGHTAATPPQGGARRLDMSMGAGGAAGGGGGTGNPNDGVTVSYAPGSSGPTRGGRPLALDGASSFDQSNYRWVPGRNLLTDIRTAQGPQQGDADDGKSAISLGAKGIASVRYGQGATSEQKALMLMTAGYAGMFSQDPVAFDAARQSAIDAGGDAPKGFAQRLASNWLQYSGGSFKSTAIAKNQFQQTLMEQATLGAESYVNGQSGNAYTGYLRSRYGAMTADQQAWGIHITSDPTSPESGWSTTVGPATDTLVKAGMPINAENRAAASNQAVMRQPQWARGQAVRGVAAYLGAMADQSLGPNAHPLERDAFVGRLAPQLSSETVEACRAIVSEAPQGQGVALCARPDYVNSVAQLMSSPDAPRKLDASTAYRNMSGVMRGSSGGAVGMQTIDILSGGGGGGFGGGGFGGGTPPAPPPMMGGFGGPTAIDAQYRDLTGGNAQNFNVAGGQVYAPPTNNNNTIIRGVNGGVGFANQTVQANIDVLAGGGGNFAMPANLANLAQPNIVQRTTFDVSHSIVADDNDVHNVDMNIQAGASGRQETLITGGGSGSAGVSNAEVDVHAEIIAPSGGPVLPPIGEFSNMQNVEQRTTTNVSFGGVGGGGAGGGSYVQQGLAQVYLNPTAGANEQSNYLNSQVASMGAQAAQSYSQNFSSAQQVVIEMMRAGFDDNSIQNPQIAAVAMQVYQQDPSMLGSAAIAAKVMQPNEMSYGSVQVVQQMVDAGWSPKNITRPDVLTSQMIIQTGAFGGAPGYGYPDPQSVRKVRQHPNFVPENTRGANNRGAFSQIPSEYFT